MLCGAASVYSVAAVVCAGGVGDVCGAHSSCCTHVGNGGNGVGHCDKGGLCKVFRLCLLPLLWVNHVAKAATHNNNNNKRTYILLSL